MIRITDCRIKRFFIGRIVRDESFQGIGIRGLYPDGKGAGYVGWIISAAINDMKATKALTSECS